MGDKSAIEWCDASWNPVTGCSHVSEGCRHCYAERWSHRYRWTSKPWTALNAAENIKLRPDRLDQPLRWRRPRRIFVNSMSDLFHEQVPDEFIDRVVGIMVRCPQHTFQVLTKRPQRLMEYFNSPAHAAGMATAGADFPLSNVWLGVSIEDQRTVDERIPLLLQTPAAVRWISAEPLLGPVDLIGWLPQDDPRRWGAAADPKDLIPDWVVCGGESGPKARPMKEEWAEMILIQCRETGVPFFMKQLSQANTREHKNFDSFPDQLRVREYPQSRNCL